MHNWRELKWKRKLVTQWETSMLLKSVGQTHMESLLGFLLSSLTVKHWRAQCSPWTVALFYWCLISQWFHLVSLLYIRILLTPKFVSPEWMSPLNSRLLSTSAYLASLVGVVNRLLRFYMSKNEFLIFPLNMSQSQSPSSQGPFILLLLRMNLAQTHNPSNGRSCCVILKKASTSLQLPKNYSDSNYCHFTWLLQKPPKWACCLYFCSTFVCSQHSQYRSQCDAITI